MSGRKVVKTGSLNVTDVIGLAVFLSFFLALLGPGILREALAVPPLSRPESRILSATQIRGAEGTASCDESGVSPLPWPAVAAYSAEAPAKAGSANEAALQRFNVTKHRSA